MDRDSKEKSERLATILREFNLNNPGAWLVEYLQNLLQTISDYLDKVGWASNSRFSLRR